MNPEVYPGRRKGRSPFDALAPDVQERLYLAYYTKPTAEIVVMVRELGIKKSADAIPPALCKWCQGYARQNRLRFCAEEANAVRVALEADPKLRENSEAVSIASQIVFERAAMQRGDVESHIALRKLRLKEQVIEHDNRRIKLLEQKAALVDQLKAESAKPGGITPEVLARIEEAAKLL